MSEDYISDLMASLKSGKFTFTGELEPGKTTDLAAYVDVAKKIKGYVVACNVTDNPQSFAYISSLVASYIVQKESGLEVIYQITCRDRNRIAIFSDLLGAGALGIKNVLALTGDHTTLGDTPQAKPVFDLDSVQLVHMIRRIVDEGVDMNGKPIESPPKFFIGAGANPNADPIEPELIKFEITEGTAMISEEATSRQLLELKRIGINISLDDFGTGYTSFSYLKKIPANINKCYYLQFFI